MKPLSGLVLLLALAACAEDNGSPVDTRDAGADVADAGGDAAVAPDAETPDTSPDDVAADDAAPDGSGTDATTDASPAGPTLGDLHARIFSVRCAPCHIDRTSGGLSLKNNEGLRDRLVGDSFQIPDLQRVSPRDVEGSYLWHKLSGTHRDVRGRGERMPMGGPYLGETELALVRTWIENGAPE